MEMIILQHKEFSTMNKVSHFFNQQIRKLYTSYGNVKYKLDKNNEQISLNESNMASIVKVIKESKIFVE